MRPALRPWQPPRRRARCRRGRVCLFLTRRPPVRVVALPTCHWLVVHAAPGRKLTHFGHAVNVGLAAFCACRLFLAGCGSPTAAALQPWLGKFRGHAWRGACMSLVLYLRVPPAAAGLSTTQDEIVEFAVRDLETGAEFDSGLIGIAQSVTRREVRSRARLPVAAWWLACSAAAGLAIFQP